MNRNRCNIQKPAALGCPLTSFASYRWIGELWYLVFSDERGDCIMGNKFHQECQSLTKLF